jgi:hypothetical protein
LTIHEWHEKNGGTNVVMGMIPLKKDRLAKDVTDDWDNFHREFNKGFDSETSDIFSRIVTCHDAGPLSGKIKSEDQLTVTSPSPNFDHFLHRAFLVDPFILRCLSTVFLAIHRSVGLPTVQVSEWHPP